MIVIVIVAVVAVTAAAMLLLIFEICYGCWRSNCCRLSSSVNLLDFVF